MPAGDDRFEAWRTEPDPGTDWIGNLRVSDAGDRCVGSVGFGGPTNGGTRDN